MQLARPPSKRRLISLTPLIDVVFILLVFFMLASSYLDWKVVDLRISAAGGKAKSAERSFVVRLGTDGSMTLDARSVTPDQVRERVAAAIAEWSDQPFVIRPEPAVPLQRAIDTLDLLKSAGAVNVSLSRDR